MLQMCLDIQSPGMFCNQPQVDCKLNCSIAIRFYTPIFHPGFITSSQCPKPGHHQGRTTETMYPGITNLLCHQWQFILHGTQNRSYITQCRSLQCSIRVAFLNRGIDFFNLLYSMWSVVIPGESNDHSRLSIRQ
ncbi:hypothetical protein D3C71_1641540 [compost metagenome]